MPLECGDLSPLFGQPAAPVRTESGDKSPHSKRGRPFATIARI
jgi:hypothetical protein